MEKLRPDIVGARALNASRKLHLPTYVATRFLLETVAGKKESSWIDEVITRKYLLQENPAFYSVTKFKKLDENNNLIYRDFIVPTPTGLLAEVIVLSSLSQSNVFNKSTRVYSYLWPTSLKSAYNFEHYISGYRKRNDDISTYLMLNDSKIVIVSDIEKFYPTIDQETVKERFVTKLESSSLSGDVKKLAAKLVDDLCHQFDNGKGIATGPELSHLLGDIALDKFDQVLSNRYGDAYFRYVDDIVLIVDPGEKDEAIALLDDLAKEEELTIHPGKTDVLTSELWQKHGPHHQNNIDDNSFEALVFRIKTFLQVNPEAENDLAEALESAGFSIPISRLSTASKSAGFGTKLIGLISIGWRVALKAAMSNEDNILKQANTVRKKIYSELSQFVEADIPDGSTLRKWHLQRLRYLTNRAVYLLTFDELEYLIPKLENIPEFIDTVALLKTLVRKDATELLQMPGAALSACASLLKHNNIKLNDIKISHESSMAQIESASIYALWDVAKIVYTNISLVNNDVVEYLKFASGVSGYERDDDKFEYLDEIKSLSLNKDKNDILKVLESRLYDTEGTVLDALDIGWNSGY